MRRLLTLIALLTAVQGWIATSHGLKSSPDNIQTLPDCLTCDQPVDLSIARPTDVGPVFFCSMKCRGQQPNVDAIDPNKRDAQRAALSNRRTVQICCPVCARPVHPDDSPSLQAADRNILFCAEPCRAKYRATPSAYTAPLANAYSCQTFCPVMGEPINPAVFVELRDGRRLYLCCKRCANRLLRAPSMYLSRWRAHGINVSPSDLPSRGPHAIMPETPASHRSAEHD